MTNIRIKEFAYEVYLMAKAFIDHANKEAKIEHKSPYDIEISKTIVFSQIKTYRFCSNTACTKRYENLDNRDILESLNEDTVKLNREIANCQRDFLGNIITMPEDKPL